MARSSTAVRLSIVPLLAASFLAGCGDDEYRGTVGAGAFFWYFGASGSGIRRGSKVSGGDRISASDRAALAKRGGFGSRSSGGGVGKSFSSGGGSGGG